MVQCNKSVTLYGRRRCCLPCGCSVRWRCQSKHCCVWFLPNPARRI